jgi:hypothetical protein
VCVSKDPTIGICQNVGDFKSLCVLDHVAITKLESCSNYSDPHFPDGTRSSYLGRSTTISPVLAMLHHFVLPRNAGALFSLALDGFNSE